MRQITINDLVPKRTVPLCYDCIHARRRGKFRECAVGGKGYKKLNEITASCGEYIKVEEE